MPTNFPGALDDFANPTATDFLDSPTVYHDEQHDNANDAIEALEAKVGVDGSTDPASIDARVAALEAGGGGGSATITYSAQNKDAATILAGQAVAAHSSGSGIKLASAANTTLPAVGLIAADTAPTFAGDVQTDGIVTMADWTAVVGSASLTRGPYFLDPTTPGMLTAIAPTTVGQIVQVVGYAVSPTSLDLSPSIPVLL